MKHLFINLALSKNIIIVKYNFLICKLLTSPLSVKNVNDYSKTTFGHLHPFANKRIV